MLYHSHISLGIVSCRGYSQPFQIRGSLGLWCHPSRCVYTRSQGRSQSKWAWFLQTAPHLAHVSFRCVGRTPTILLCCKELRAPNRLWPSRTSQGGCWAVATTARMNHVPGSKSLKFWLRIWNSVLKYMHRPEIPHRCESHSKSVLLTHWNMEHQWSQTSLTPENQRSERHWDTWPRRKVVRDCCEAQEFVAAKGQFVGKCFYSFY